MPYLTRREVVTRRESWLNTRSYSNKLTRRKKMMKKILLVGILLTALMFTTIPIASAGEPPSCGGPGTWNLLGPPVVGTLVIKLVSIGDPYNILSFKFKGCCADCFKRCVEPSCDVIIKIEAPFAFTPDNFHPEWLQDYNLVGWGPKGCFSRKGGEDLVITNILKYEVKDTNGDGINEAFADIVMYYWECKP
jgi:hypothetical protein